MSGKRWGSRLIRTLFTRTTQSYTHCIGWIILSIALMIVDKEVVHFKVVRAVFMLAVTPIQYIVHTPIQWFDVMTVTLHTHRALIAENTQLKNEQLLLRAQLQRFTTIESENIALKSLVRRASEQIKQKTIIAELLAVSSTPYARQVVINRGWRDGAYVGQPVLDANGVMGQLVQVGMNTSRLMLVNDQKSGVAVQNARNGLRTVAVGNSYSGQLHLLYLSKTTDIQLGDVFVTSGLGDHYPSGYPVGVVRLIVKDPKKSFLTVTLQPSAQVDSSRQVLLLWHPSHA